MYLFIHQMATHEPYYCTHYCH